MRQATRVVSQGSLEQLTNSEFRMEEISELMQGKQNVKQKEIYQLIKHLIQESKGN